MTAVHSLGIFVLAAALLSAQQKQPKKLPASHTVERDGIVSGRVFLITVSGELKPARMAEIHAIPLRNINGLPSDETLASTFESFAHRHIETLLHKRGWQSNDYRSCKTELQAYEEGYYEMLNFAAEHGRNEFLLISGKADEEGNFKLKVPLEKEELYAVYAHGRAGYNDAIWDQITFAFPGKESVVKLSDPARVCFEPVE